MKTQSDFSMIPEFVAQKWGVELEDNREVTLDLAAIGIAASIWRYTHLEKIHRQASGPLDPEMMAMNVSATRLCRSALDAPTVSWNELAARLSDPDRELPDGRRLTQLAGRSIGPLARDIEKKGREANRLEKEHGQEQTLHWFALRGLLLGDDWWGTPWWPSGVVWFLAQIREESFVATSPPPMEIDDLQTLMITAPDALPAEALEWYLDNRLIKAVIDARRRL